MQVIYIDVIFGLNIVMNTFIIHIATVLLNYRVRRFKIITGIFLASILACLPLLIYPLSGGVEIVYQLVTPIVPLYYMYKPNTFKVFIKNYCVCMIVTYAVGGIAFSLHDKLSLFGSAYDVILPILSGVWLWGIVWYGLTWIRKQKVGFYCDYDMELVHQSKKITLKGYLDTGNTLYTTDHQPVLVIPIYHMLPLLSLETIALIKACEVNNPIDVLVERPNKKTKLYVIPFESIGKKNGILLGIAIDQITFKRGSYSQTVEQCIVGITTQTIFKTDSYEALIHPELILKK